MRESVHRLRRIYFATGISFIALCVASSASAAEVDANEAIAQAQAAGDQIASEPVSDEIIVTANRRAQALQDTPVAVTALTPIALDRLQVTNVFDLNRVAPNLVISEAGGSATAPGIIIRGIGLKDSTWNSESGVALYVDDAYIAGQAGTAFDLLDVERIEVLRGPQSTLYGRNSTAGAVKVVIRRPNLLQPEFKADTLIGNYGRLTGRLSASVPIIRDELAIKVDAVAHHRDGYVFNRTLNNNAKEENRVTARVSLLGQVTDNLELYIIGDYVDDDSGILIPTPTRFIHATGRHEPIFGANIGESGVGVRDVNHSKVRSTNAQFTWDVSDAGTIKLIGTNRRVTSSLSGDLDGLAAGRQIPGTPLFLNIDFDETKVDELSTVELQWQGGKDDRLDYLAGAYYFDRLIDQDVWTKLVFPTGMRQVARQATKSYAAFGDATLALGDRLEVFGGLRWTTEQKKVDHAGAIALVTGVDTPFVLSPFPGATLFNFQNIKRRWSELSHRIGAKWDVTDDTMVYVSRSRGFKPGQIVSARGPDPVGSGTFTDKETATTYEVGLRSKPFDSVTFNATAYYQQYKDLQTGSLDVNLRTTTDDVDISGLEIEASWKPVEQLTFYGSYGYNHGKYDRPGLVLKDAPEHLGNIGATFEQPLAGGSKIELNTNLVVQGKFYHANIVRNPARLQAGYSLLDASISFETADSRWRFTVGGKNILDKRYAFLADEFFGLPPELEPQPIANIFYARGVEWMATIRFTY